MITNNRTPLKAEHLKRAKVGTADTKMVNFLLLPEEEFQAKVDLLSAEDREFAIECRQAKMNMAEDINKIRLNTAKDLLKVYKLEIVEQVIKLTDRDLNILRMQ